MGRATGTRVFWHDLVYTVARFRRSKTIKTDPSRNSRRHWRPSLRKYILALSQPTPEHPAPQCSPDGILQQRTTEGAFLSPYMRLPVELIDIIEDLLSPTDIACLRQTCRSLRNIDRAYRYSSIRDLSPIHLYSSRRRLDRDTFPLLCLLETLKQLPHKLVACNACLTLHKRELFEDEQLSQTLALIRVCKASQYVFEVNGHYKVSASTLRRILEQFAESRIEPSVDLGNVKRPKGLTRTKTRGHRRIEKVLTNSSLGTMSTIALDHSGLHLLHQYRDYIRVRRFRLWWGREQVLWVCPYLPQSVINLAQGGACDIVGLLSSNAFSSSCNVEGCRAAFAFLDPESGLSRKFQHSFFSLRIDVGRLLLFHLWFRSYMNRSNA
jgi:hypothetical protein